MHRSRRPDPARAWFALTLRQAAEALPGVVTSSDVRRWQKSGYGETGIRLECVWVEGRCCTTVSGLRVFLDRINAIAPREACHAS